MFISRYTTIDSAPAYSTAMHADSVAVNQPNTLPPMMMNGVNSAGTDTIVDLTTSMKVARG